MASPPDIRTREEDSLLAIWELSSRHAASVDARRVKALSDRFDLMLEVDPFGSRYHDMAVRSLAAEVAAAGHISSGVAEGMLHRAHTIVHCYPSVLAAMETGLVTLRHAEAIAAAGAALDDAPDAARAEYERRALDVALNESAGRTESAARMIAADIAPVDLAERHRRARSFHGVHVWSRADGLGELQITGSELLVRAAYDRADAMAKALISSRTDVGTSRLGDDDAGPDACGDGDDRSLAQVRADIMLELLLAGGAESLIGTPAEAIRATVQVTISSSTLAGDDDRMAEIDGTGPVLPEIVRDLAGRTSSWSRLLLTPSGMLTATSAYTPTAEMKRFLRARDQRCRFPGCVRPAQRCEIDHNHDHAKGGRTEVGNLACFCTSHHPLKHPDLDDRHRWSVRQQADGVIEWISPRGRVFTDRPSPRVAFV
ncbi:DUF222 domain-containing protein [Microbacterium sp. NPDC055903]